ncbi:MAG TPA: RDD family protein [Bacteroidia bacterium]|nr:RDD family protein [Bacteroidia bacterium]
MKKITALTEKRKRTEYVKDANGNREKKTVEYTAIRPVKTVSQGPRFGHFILDYIAFYFVIYVITFIFQLMLIMTSVSESAQLTISFVQTIMLFLLYPALYAFCEFCWQKTPGKYLTKTIVIDEYGNKPTGKAIIARSLFRIVPFEGLSCLGDFSHGWHDSWSKTWVVPLDELAEIKKLQAEQSETI